jgi:hypothetical protein
MQKLYPCSQSDLAALDSPSRHGRHCLHQPGARRSARPPRFRRPCGAAARSGPCDGKWSACDADGDRRPALSHRLGRPAALSIRPRRGSHEVICGYMTCDPQLSRMLLAGLPKIIKINIRDEASGRWPEGTLRYSVDHAEASGPGVAAVVAKLSEALFVETSRRFISALPQAQTGWLAGASRTSARPWPSSIGSRLSPGQWPRSRTKWACPVPCSPSAFGTISPRRRSAISRAGGCTSPPSS